MRSRRIRGSGCGSRVFDPRSDLDQGLGPEPAGSPLAVATASDQPRLLEDLEVRGSAAPIRAPDANEPPARGGRLAQRS